LWKSAIDRLSKKTSKSDKNKVRQEIKTAYNSTYKKVTIQWINHTLCFLSNLVVADSFVLPCRQAGREIATFG
jgi:hypothetical protein